MQCIIMRQTSTEEEVSFRTLDLILSLLLNIWQRKMIRTRWAGQKMKFSLMKIIKCLDSTEGPDYVYTISTQGHGAYPEEQLIDDPEITVTGAATEAQNNQWEYYCNEIHEMDNFVKELTDALADYPEDVILVMYGDHLPTMGLTVEDLKNKYLFQTEYVMWDNFGMEKKKVNLSAYQMAAEVMDRAGIHEGTIFRYHQARKKIPRNYPGRSGKRFQYDLLYGEKVCIQR